MTPHPGTRLHGGPGAAYDVVGPGWADARHEYVKARKRFRNFRFPAEALDESPDDESLDALIRIPRPTTAVDSSSDAFERETVLALPGMTCFLEPIDLVTTAAQGEGGGWLVFADPHAGRLGGDPATTADRSALVVTFGEALGMLDALHGSGLEVGPMGAEDFLVDPSGRWFYLGTDRIGPASGPGGFRSDLAHWARLTDGLLGGAASDSGATGWAFQETVRGEALDQAKRLFERVRRCLTDEPTSDMKPGTAGPRGGLSLWRRLVARRGGGS